MASTTDWARAVATTITNYLKQEEIATLRRYRVWSMIESGGNVLTNQSGRGFTWEIQFRQQPVSGNDGETPRQFSRHNLWQTAALDYRGYQSTDMLYTREMLENRGQQALIQVAGKMATRLQTSIEQKLAGEVYVDGDEPGNELRFQGLDSFFDYDGSINIADGTHRGTGVVNENDRFLYPKDTYAGLSTELGAIAGSQTAEGAWPDAQCDPEYDYYTPIIINALSKSFADSGEWVDTCVAAIREGIHQARRNDTKEAGIDLVMLDRRMFIDCLNNLDAKERTIVSKTNGLKSFGFSDVFEIDGCEVSTEYNVPVGCGYGLSTQNMALHSMQPQIIQSDGPYYSETTQGYRYVASVLANLKMVSPRNFFKLVQVTP